MQTLDLQIQLAEGTIEKLQNVAEARGISEAEIVAQAIDLFLAFDDPASDYDYWFSVGAMREDWDLMPDDWMLVKQ